MYRSINCGALRLCNKDQKVTLAGWVQKIRRMGGMTFLDLRDRYGITQITFNSEVNPQLLKLADEIGREFVVQITGTVKERSSKNKKIPTGEIEIEADEIKILNPSVTPPFTIEDETESES